MFVSAYYFQASLIFVGTFRSLQLTIKLDLGICVQFMQDLILPTIIRSSLYHKTYYGRNLRISVINQCLSVASFSNLVQYLWVRLQPTQVKNLQVLHSRVCSQSFPQTLDQAGTNTLAYNVKSVNCGRYKFYYAGPSMLKIFYRNKRSSLFPWTKNDLLHWLISSNIRIGWQCPTATCTLTYYYMLL